MNINEIEKAYQEWLDLPETKQERELFTLKATPGPDTTCGTITLAPCFTRMG